MSDLLSILILVGMFYYGYNVANARKKNGRRRRRTNQK